MNKVGHRIWAGMLLIIIVFLINYYNLFPINDLILNNLFFSLALILVYIFSSGLVDKWEKSYPYNSRIFKGSHRKFLHSWTWFKLTFWALIPFSIWLADIYSENWLFLTSILFSHISHILGDFLCGRIPK